MKTAAPLRMRDRSSGSMRCPTAVPSLVAESLEDWLCSAVLRAAVQAHHEGTNAEELAAHRLVERARVLVDEWRMPACSSRLSGLQTV